MAGEMGSSSSSMETSGSVELGGQSVEYGDQPGFEGDGASQEMSDNGYQEAYERPDDSSELPGNEADYNQDNADYQRAYEANDSQEPDNSNDGSSEGQDYDCSEYRRAYSGDSSGQVEQSSGGEYDSSANEPQNQESSSGVGPVRSLEAPGQNTCFESEYNSPEADSQDYESVNDFELQQDDGQEQAGELEDAPVEQEEGNAEPEADTTLQEPNHQESEDAFRSSEDREAFDPVQEDEQAKSDANLDGAEETASMEPRQEYEQNVGDATGDAFQESSADAEQDAFATIPEGEPASDSEDLKGDSQDEKIAVMESNQESDRILGVDPKDAPEKSLSDIESDAFMPAEDNNQVWKEDASDDSEEVRSQHADSKLDHHSSSIDGETTLDSAKGRDGFFDKAKTAGTAFGVITKNAFLYGKENGDLISQRELALNESTRGYFEGELPTVEGEIALSDICEKASYYSFDGDRATFCFSSHSRTYRYECSKSQLQEYLDKRNFELYKASVPRSTPSQIVDDIGKAAHMDSIGKLEHASTILAASGSRAISPLGISDVYDGVYRVAKHMDSVEAQRSIKEFSSEKTPNQLIIEERLRNPDEAARMQREIDEIERIFRKLEVPPKEIQSIEEVRSWLPEINPNYDCFDYASPYSNNCGSCALAVSRRLDGDNSAVAGPFTLSISEMEAKTGLDQVSMTPESIRDELIQKGPGSHAVVGVDRLRGPGHWFNAYCPDGKTVYAIDGQTGEVQGWPPDYGNVVNWDMSKKVH